MLLSYDYIYNFLYNLNYTIEMNEFVEKVGGAHLAAHVAKFPAPVQVWGCWHGVTNTGYANVSESQINDDSIRGSTQLSELHKHQQHHNVTSQTDHSW